MSTTFTVVELVLAFVKYPRQDARSPRVTFSWGPASDDLIRIFGPDATTEQPGTVVMAIDRRTGDALFADMNVALVIGATRTSPLAGSPSEHDEFGWTLSREEIAVRFATPGHFASAVMHASEQGSARW